MISASRPQRLLPALRGLAADVDQGAGDHRDLARRTVKLRIHAAAGSDRQRHHQPVTINVVDAYRRDHKVEVDGSAELLVETRAVRWLV